jgi:hypothetical protein
MSYQREHRLQAAIKSFVKHCVAVDHLFMAFDRSAKKSDLQHILEKNRGIRTGTPDTVLLFSGRAVWVELKAGSNKPTDAQEQIGNAIQRTGHVWGWANSVDSYRQFLAAQGVAMTALAPVTAQDFDLRLAAKDQAAPKRPGKPRAQRPQASKLRALARQRAEGIF